MRQAGDIVSGCKDTGAPEVYSPYELSRITDAMDIVLAKAGEKAQRELFAALPAAAKIEWNYSNWVYVLDEKDPRNVRSTCYAD